MYILTKPSIIITVCYLFFVNIALAGANEEIINLQKSWEKLNYQTPIPEQEKEFESLLIQSKKITSQYNDLAESHIWQGIIEATFADLKNDKGEKNSALSLAALAKKSFVDAIKLNPYAMHGAAFTNLGALYYQVPSWPISFGDNRKAEEFLMKGLELNPDDIDANYFYGDFLFQKGNLLKSQHYFIKASQAQEREGREIGDKERKKDIEDMLKKITYLLHRQ